MVFGNGFETDLRLDYSGNHTTAYEAAPQSLSSTVSTIQRSLDGGLTWKLVPGQASGSSGGKNFTCPAGGGDAELDTSAGHLYYDDLTLANFSVARSDDQGMTFPTTNCAGVLDTGVDRPWLTHLGDPTTPNTTAANGPGEFMVYDEAPGVAGISGCGSPAASIGGNILVASRSPVFGDSTGVTAGVQYSASLNLSCDEGIMGNDETFDYGVAGGGAKFYVVHDNAALTSVSMVRCDIGVETATNATGLTNCSDNLISSFPGSKTGANFPTMAVDDHGNLFAVWEQSLGGTGNTLLYFSTSMNQGTSWSTPAQIPTGQLQNVFAWPAAGDSGAIDVAFYGAPEAASGTAGPDSTLGHYSLYLSQTLNNGLSWSTTLASEHFTHYGTMYTLIGGQTGNRTLGDFLQTRLGPQGEANISFSDSNNQNSGSNPEGMFVRQNSGPSLFRAQNGTGLVSLPAAPTGNCASGDAASANDATFDAANTVGSNNPNLDITNLCMSESGPNYVVQMTVAGDLTNLTPGTGAGGTTQLWQTQWHEPSHADTTNGGDLLFVYAESVAGQAPTCWYGHAATFPAGTGGGVQLTYPGDPGNVSGKSTQLPSAACVFATSSGNPGVITITVPVADFGRFVVSPDSTTLYSVTGSTQTIPTGNVESDAAYASGIGGVLFNVIDAAPAFDVNPAGCTGPQCNVPEAPWVPLLLVVPGAGALAVGIRRQRRAGRTFIERSEVQ